jgi:hypothetical protein
MIISNIVITNVSEGSVFVAHRNFMRVRCVTKAVIYMEIQNRRVSAAPLPVRRDCCQGAPSQAQYLIQFARQDLVTAKNHQLSS